MGIFLKTKYLQIKCLNERLPESSIMAKVYANFALLKKDTMYIEQIDLLFTLIKEFHNTKPLEVYKTLLHQRIK